MGVIAVAGLLQLSGAVAHAASPAPAPTYQPTDSWPWRTTASRATATGGSSEATARALGGSSPHHAVHLRQGYHIRSMRRTASPGSAPSSSAVRAAVEADHLPTGAGTSRLPMGTARSSTRGSRQQDLSPSSGRSWGATTTTTAAADPSLSRLPKAERPVTWRAITLLVPRHGEEAPRAHLQAPDCAALARHRDVLRGARRRGPRRGRGWTLTFRRVAAPLEGASAPTTAEGKSSIVWIAVLHGSFTDGSASDLPHDRPRVSRRHLAGSGHDSVRHVDVPAAGTDPAAPTCRRPSCERMASEERQMVRRSGAGAQRRAGESAVVEAEGELHPRRPRGRTAGRPEGVHRGPHASRQTAASAGLPASRRPQQ